MNKLSRMHRLFHDGKIVMVALDQGMEHGPSDFDSKTMNPANVIKSVSKDADALMCNKGVAEKNRHLLECPLILKLTGKTALSPLELQAQIASVDDAVRLNATAVAATVYVGSPFESQMLERFAGIQAKSVYRGMPVMMLAYPRTKNEKSVEAVSYAARVGLEQGADIVKTYWTGSAKSFEKVVGAAGGVPVLMAGGKKTTPLGFLKVVEEAMQAGASGIAVGRNVWQHPKPRQMLAAVKAIVHNGDKPAKAIKLVK